MVRIISTLILAVTAACASAGENIQLVDNPPDRHIVVPGDTLWGISRQFLKDPLQWPAVWRLNKEQIRNPHRIYPGDIVLLDRSSGEPRLTIAKPVKLEPRIHSTPVQQEIASIPQNIIEPFLSQPLAIEPNAHDHLPRIVAIQEDRVFVGPGDTIFAKGIPDAAVVKWNVFRQGKPLKDPENGQIIAHEAFFLGHAELVQPGELATLRVKTLKEEIGMGDRLLPAPPGNIIAYVPHRPDSPVKARVMSIYGGVNEAGKFSIISLNRGANEKLEIGHVVALFRNRTSAGYDDNGKRIVSEIPEERYALAFVFRVFDRVAYALVMESAKPVIVGDSARNP